MIFLRSARFFRRFREYVCPAFSAPGFRSGVLRTSRLNTLGREPGSTGQGGKRQRSEVGDQKSEVRSQRSEVRSQSSEIRTQNAEDEIAGFYEVVMPCNIIHIMALRKQVVHITNFGILHIS